MLHMVSMRTNRLAKIVVFSLLITTVLTPLHSVYAVLDNIPPAELYLPLKGPKQPKIGEGWKYSEEEKIIHGVSTHSSIDFEAKRGTAVYAAADGYALASYHMSYLVRIYNGKGPIGFGLGNFVQIWHPDLGVYTSYSHLGKSDSSIPYFAPTKYGTSWSPDMVYLPPDFSERNGKLVKRGDLIGYVGDTGLAWGYEESPINRPDPKLFPSWDDPHLHFEVYDRDPKTFLKKNRYDPYGIYGEIAEYRTTVPATNSLWKIDKQGYPLFAK